MVRGLGFRRREGEKTCCKDNNLIFEGLIVNQATDAGHVLGNAGHVED